MVNNDLNGYLAFYNGKKTEVYARTSYEAQQQAVKLLKVTPKNSYKVSVHLCEKAGETVIHTAEF